VAKIGAMKIKKDELVVLVAPNIQFFYGFSKKVDFKSPKRWVVEKIEKYFC